MGMLDTNGTGLMSRPKGRPKAKGADDAQAARITIINLKGTQEQADWLARVNRKTSVPKAAIIRKALVLWAKQNGHPPFPASEAEADD